MSWILGYIGEQISESTKRTLQSLHGEPLVCRESDSFYVAAGGIRETCFYDDGESNGASWLIVGLGLERVGGHCRTLSSKDWQSRIDDEHDLCRLDGHYVALRWSRHRLRAAVDPLGLRTLYFLESDDGLSFSTRLDWLSSLTGRSDVDLEAFGGHWLLFNQMTTCSLVRGIRRLGPGGELFWARRAGSTWTERPWTPQFDESDRNGRKFAETLSAFVRPLLAADRHVSLGLSGGLDSRLLLALLPRSTARTHVFGADDHPDVYVSRAVAKAEGISQKHFNGSVPDAAVCQRLLRDHFRQTPVVSPASAVVGLRYYPALQEGNVLMIDGGFGEIVRRQYLNRLRSNVRALRTMNPASLLPLLSSSRVDVFSPDVVELMRNGAQSQIAALTADLPGVEDVGVENVLDLIGVRTRAPNFFGFEQARLDGLVQNYMPFAQPSTVAAVFRMPVSLRAGGTLVRRIISESGGSLTRYPLVKGGATYPYRFSTLSSFVWTRAKRMMGFVHTDGVRTEFLDRLRPYVLDTVRSNVVQSCDLYDRARLSRIIESYYGGRTELASQVDWWLAFEEWRQACTA